jgi:hypothetical protein
VGTVGLYYKADVLNLHFLKNMYRTKLTDKILQFSVEDHTVGMSPFSKSHSTSVTLTYKIITLLKSTAFWVLKVRFVKILTFRRYRDVLATCFFPVRCFDYSSTLKTEAIRPSETSALSKVHGVAAQKSLL